MDNAEERRPTAGDADQSERGGRSITLTLTEASSSLDEISHVWLLTHRERLPGPLRSVRDRRCALSVLDGRSLLLETADQSTRFDPARLVAGGVSSAHASCQPHRREGSAELGGGCPEQHLLLLYSRYRS